MEDNKGGFKVQKTATKLDYFFLKQVNNWVKLQFNHICGKLMKSLLTGDAYQACFWTGLRKTIIELTWTDPIDTFSDLRGDPVDACNDALFSELNHHHSPYCTNSERFSKEFKPQNWEVFLFVVELKKADVCSRKFTMNMCAISADFMTISSCRMTHIKSEKPANLVLNYFLVQSEAARTILACFAEQKCFCPGYKNLSHFFRTTRVELWQPSFYS